MGVSTLTLDRVTFAPVTTNAGGLATFAVDVSGADKMYRIVARCYAVIASGGHLQSAGSWCCEYVVKNTGGGVGVAAIAAVTSSANPDNFAGLVGFRVEAADTAFAGTTGVWTISGTTALLTVTLQAASGTKAAGASVFVVCEVESVGAT